LGQAIILVEGVFDKRVMQAFLLGAEVHGWSGAGRVVVDSADIIESPLSGAMGNRRKVEEVSRGLHRLPDSGNIVCFVDREFRGFVDHGTMEDRLGSEHVIGRLVWSRGHSLENYAFDVDILTRTLRMLSPTTWFAHALAQFDANFRSILLIACAASLAGRDEKSLQVVESRIDWTMLSFADGAITVDEPAWKALLLTVRGWDEVRVDAIIASFNGWLTRLASVDTGVLRWLCHGHIGQATIWAAYARCVHEVATSDPVQEARNALGVSKEIRSLSAAERWLEHTFGSGAPPLVVVLELLGLRRS
jgi:hypothetical protein